MQELLRWKCHFQRKQMWSLTFFFSQCSYFDQPFETRCQLSHAINNMHRTVICIIREKNKQKQAQRLMPAGVARKRFLQYPVDATDCVCCLLCSMTCLLHTNYVTETLWVIIISTYNLKQVFGYLKNDLFGSFSEIFSCKPWLLKHCRQSDSQTQNPRNLYYFQIKSRDYPMFMFLQLSTINLFKLKLKESAYC